MHFVKDYENVNEHFWKCLILADESKFYSFRSDGHQLNVYSKY